MINSCLLKYKSFEDDQDIFERGQSFKRFIKAHLDAQPLPEGEKLAIVCHSKFICSLTASHVTVQDDSPQMSGFIWTNNCETIPWKL